MNDFYCACVCACTLSQTGTTAHLSLFIISNHSFWCLLLPPLSSPNWMSPPLRNPQHLWFFALAVSNLKHHNEVCTAQVKYLLNISKRAGRKRGGGRWY